MITRKFAISLLVTLFGSTTAAAEGTICGQQDKYGLSAPDGWTIDTEVGKQNGADAVAFPKGSSWSKSPAVMYVNTSGKAVAGQETLEKLIDYDLQRFRKEFGPSLVASPIRKLQLRGNRIAHLRDFSGDLKGNFETVAYIDAPASVILLVLTARTKTAFTESSKAFQSFVQSYVVVDPKKLALVRSIDEARAKAALKHSEADLATEKGKTYDDTFGMHFGTKHGSLVQTCVQREKGSKVPMDFVLKLDANGRVLESFIVVPSSLANCIMNSLEKDTWPRPPFAPFYGHMHLEITE